MNKRIISKRLTAVFMIFMIVSSMVLSVNAESYTYTKGTAELTAVWSDAYLDGPTTTYRDDLMRFCMDLTSLSPKAESIKDGLDALGFTYERQVNYDKDPTIQEHSSAYTIYSKTAKANGKDVKLYVIVIEPNSMGEFVGNFDFASNPAGSTNRNYNTQEAYPFTESARIIKADLDQMVQQENIRFLVTGYSRGGGVANFLGKLLNDAYGPDKVQAYGFATPNVAMIAQTDRETSFYKNLFNIINPEDLVTYVPMDGFDIVKYGQTLLLDAEKGAASRAPELYWSYSEKNYYGYRDNGVVVSNFVDNTLERLAPTVQQYYEDTYPAYRNYTVTQGFLLSTKVTTGNLVEMSLFDFVQYVFAKYQSLSNLDANINTALQIIELYYELKSIEKDPVTNEPLPFAPILQFLLKHGLGYDSIDEMLRDLGLDLTDLMGVVSSLGNLDDIGEKLILREMVVAHFLESARAYVTAMEDPFLNEEILETGKQDQISNEVAALSSAGAFYSDMKLTASMDDSALLETVYDLGLTVPTVRDAETFIRPNGLVVVSLTLPESYDPEDTYTLYRGDNLVPFEIEEGRLFFTTDQLGSFTLTRKMHVEEIALLRFENQIAQIGLCEQTGVETVVIAGYTKDGRLTKAYVETLTEELNTVNSYGFPTQTATVELFLLGDGYVPAD